MAKREHEEEKSAAPDAAPSAKVAPAPTPAPVQTQSIPRVDRGAIRLNVDAWISVAEATPIAPGQRHTLTLTVGLDSGFTSSSAVDPVK